MNYNINKYYNTIHIISKWHWSERDYYTISENPKLISLLQNYQAFFTTKRVMASVIIAHTGGD